MSRRRDSASRCSPPCEFEQTAAQGKEDCECHGAQRVISGGVEEQHADTDAGGALHIAFSGRWRLPCRPAPASVPDQEGQQHANPQPSSLQPDFQIIIVGLVEEAAVKFVQGLDRAIDGVEASDAGPEREVGLGRLRDQGPTFEAPFGCAFSVEPRKDRREGKRRHYSECCTNSATENQQSRTRAASSSCNPGSQQTC